MASLLLDPKKFKHISSDDKQTTLEHQDGHRLIVAHGKLSAENQKMLKSLMSAAPAKEEEPKKMMQGGATDEQSDTTGFGNLEMAPEGATLADTSAAPQSIAPAAAPSDRDIASAKEPSLAEAPQAIAAAPTSSDLETAGILQGVDAVTQQAGLQQSALIRQQQGIAEAKIQHDAAYAQLDNDRKQIIQEMQSGEISPEKFWTGDKDGNGGHSRITSAIGMIVAGFGGVQGVKTASDFLNKQIDFSIDAQKENLGKQKTLLEANLSQFGNLRDAEAATRLNLNDATINELQLAAAKAASPMAKAAALKEIGQLMAKQEDTQKKLALNQVIGQLSSGKMSPEATEASLSALETFDPKRAKDLKERYVPGVGFASSIEGAKNVREMQTTVSTIKSGIKRLKEISKQTGKSLSPSAIAEADTIRNSLIGRLRVPITGPGAMSEGERELLMRMVPDVTALFSLDSSNIKRLDTLDKLVEKNYNSMASANGLKVSQQAEMTAPKYSREQMESWARANSTNPKAAQILKQLGK